MKKLKYNFALASAFLIATVLNQEIFFLLQDSLQSLVRPEKYLITFFIFFLFTFIKQRALRFLSLSFILFLNLFQMSHIQYFGTPAQASEVYLFFAEAFEVYGTLKEEIHLLLVPILLTLVPLIFLWIADLKLAPKIKKAPWVGFIFVFYLVYNPMRTYITGNTWGRQPSSEELGGMNIYLSTSYFLGRILPAKLSNPRVVASQKANLRPTTPFDGDVILVLGESLSSNHLSLLGYHRPTTPLLDALKDDPNFHYTEGVSSGVSSDIAVAFLLNITYGLGGGPVVYKGNQCLYKLAQKSAFKTHFISSQSQQQLRYIANSICPKFIENYKSLDDLRPDIEDSNAADDLVLLGEFETLSSEKNNFVIFHQRGSHSPYNLRYPKDQEIFPMVEDAVKNRINHYDNSVYQFDKFMAELIEKIKKRDRPTLLVYVSDHGEGLGEQGHWGHGKLVESSVKVPILTYSHKAPTPAPFEGMPTHLNVSLLLAKFLGHAGETPYSEPLKKYNVLGNDIDGFAGQLELEFEDGQIKNKRLIQE